MSTLALTELIGAAVFDAAGTRCGRVRELAMILQEDRARVAMLIVRTKSGDRMLPSSSITSIEASVRSDVSCSQWATSDGSEGWLLLGRDLLDQQVIDVFGRKVVRVNDVDLHQELVPDEREAVFETLDEQVAAAALEEVHPKVQKAIVESLDSERAADIVEEMEPDAAADLLADLPEERTSEILLEMEPQERKEMVELLEFKENTAAGRMTTEYLALRPDNTAADAVEALRNFGGGVETVSTIYIVDSLGTLIGAVPLARLVLSEPNTPLLALTQEPLISTRAGASEREVAELFDKYNLVTLPVVDENKKLTGVITSDDVISLLRAKL